MKRIAPFALLLTILSCSGAIFSQQGVPPLAKEVEKVLEEKEPAWKIQRPYRQMSPPVMHLKSVSEGDVLIYFWLMDNEVDVKSVFDGQIISLGNTLGDRKKESKLPNLGDDNRLISDRSGRFAHLVFYKGKTLINIAAPTDMIAKRFAKHVAQRVAPIKEAAESGK
ncbi:MAG TPA: hypothetical protein VFZ49_06520 [Pyrinomonadaceae bacterium]